jgi:hypothetical protein
MTIFPSSVWGHSGDEVAKCFRMLDDAEGVGVMDNQADRKTVTPTIEEERSTALVPVLEERYAYYRRCTQLRRNGQQCKGPAMKGETVCYSHFNQAELARFRERERNNILGALGRLAGTRNEAGRALNNVIAAFTAGRIDAKTAAKMMREIRVVVSASPAKEAGASEPDAAHP